MSTAVFLAAGAILCMEGRASIGGDTTFTNNIASHGGETLGESTVEVVLELTALPTLGLPPSCVGRNATSLRP